MTDTGTAVVTRNGQQSIQKSARAGYDAEQVALIKATVAKDCSDAEFAMYLDLAGRYQLDPFAREIFAAKIGSRDGQSGRVAIIVGRDGFLKIANRHEDFLGLEGDVVREHDTFRKKAGEIYPEHTYEGHVLPPLNDDKGKPKVPIEWPPNARGAIVGAWAVVQRRDRMPTYFYAPWSEYVPNADRKSKTPWGKQESAMILKCAETTALRKAYSITGVWGEEEMASALVQEEVDAGVLDYGDEPTMRAWLPKLFVAVNEAKPNSIRPAKQRLLLKGLDQDEREALAADLVTQIEKLGGTVPERPTVEQMLAEAENEDVPDEDVEVVQEGEYVPTGDPSKIPFPDLTDHEGDAETEAAQSDDDAG